MRWQWGPWTLPHVLFSSGLKSWRISSPFRKLLFHVPIPGYKLSGSSLFKTLWPTSIRCQLRNNYKFDLQTQELMDWIDSNWVTQGAVIHPSCSFFVRSSCLFLSILINQSSLPFHLVWLNPRRLCRLYLQLIQRYYGSGPGHTNRCLLPLTPQNNWFI